MSRPVLDSPPPYTRSMPPETDLLTPLRRYWGYDSFRPLQENIVRSLLGGRDTCVVMPTGGGKSLCYQLPALVLGQTAVVVSPLIALMQDQAAQLAQMGIPAAVLNSAMPSGGPWSAPSPFDSIRESGIMSLASLQELIENEVTVQAVQADMTSVPYGA